MTACITGPIQFQRSAGRDVLARFDAGTLSSDGGLLLLQQVETKLGLLRRAAGCFTDHRDPRTIEPTVFELLAQRVIGLCLGDEDLNDHDLLRTDPLFAMACGKTDPEGLERRDPADRGKPLAGKSNLNRLELTPAGAGQHSRYKKIRASLESLQDVLVEAFLAQHPDPPQELILDLDATAAQTALLPFEWRRRAAASTS